MSNPAFRSYSFTWLLQTLRCNFSTASLTISDCTRVRREQRLFRTCALKVNIQSQHGNNLRPPNITVRRNVMHKTRQVYFNFIYVYTILALVKLRKTVMLTVTKRNRETRHGCTKNFSLFKKYRGKAEKFSIQATCVTAIL